MCRRAHLRRCIHSLQGFSLKTIRYEVVGSDIPRETRVHGIRVFSDSVSTQLILLVEKKPKSELIFDVGTKPGNVSSFEF